MDTAFEATDAAISVEALYRADAERLWRAVLAFSSDPEIASDAVAEAYVQLIRRGDGVRDGAAWTWRAAFKIAAGTLKQRISPPPVDGGTGYVDAYQNADLLAALARLPEAQRAAVILHYYADLPVREIASRLGTNGLAVRANLSRGRRRLRELLGDDDV